MMNIKLFHGSAGTPESFWFPWLTTKLEQNNYQVWVPQLPNVVKPELDQWLPYALKNGKYDEQTILVGHSSGCTLILSILENLDVKIKKVILVAGFACTLDPKVENPILQKMYYWEKIKNNVESIIIINSDNDPWGCDDKAGKYIFDNIGGTQIIRDGEGHMGSLSFNQPYKEFPFLLEMIESTTM